MTETPIERKAHDTASYRSCSMNAGSFGRYSVPGSSAAAAASDALMCGFGSSARYWSITFHSVTSRFTPTDRGAGTGDRVQTLANTLYPRFAEATDAAIAFNDKYEALSGNALGRSWTPICSVWGGLNIRFALEDQLIDAMSE